MRVRTRSDSDSESESLEDLILLLPNHTFLQMMDLYRTPATPPVLDRSSDRLFDNMIQSIRELKLFNESNRDISYDCFYLVSVYLTYLIMN